MSKKRTVYIHIGSPKTGTTSIQQFLTINSNILLRKGVFYPTTGRQYTQNDIFNFQGKVKDIVTNNSRSRAKKNPIICINGNVMANYMYNESAFKKIIDDFRDSNSSTLILSDEVLFTEIKNNICDKDNVWNLLSGFEVKIIVYLKRSTEYLCGLWQEEVKDRYSNSLDYYLKNHPYKECLQIIHDLSDKVGIENIIIKTFEKELWINNNLIDDFLSIFDIKNSDQFEALEEDNNISFKRSRSEKFRFINRYIDITIGKNHHNILKKIPEEENDQRIVDSISDELIKKTSDQYYPDECRIAEIFLSKKELFINKYPKIYKVKRDEYLPHLTKEDKEELRFVITSITQQQSIKIQELITSTIKQNPLRNHHILSCEKRYDSLSPLLFRLKKISVLFLCSLTPSKKYRANIRRMLLRP